MLHNIFWICFTRWIDGCLLAKLFMLALVFLLTLNLFHKNGSVFVSWPHDVCSCSLLTFFLLLSLLGHLLPPFGRTCQKTVDSSCWWRHVSTSSRTTRMSSPLLRVISSAWLVRRMAAGGRGCSMAGLGGFLATMSARSKAQVGTSTASVRTECGDSWHYICFNLQNCQLHRSNYTILNMSSSPTCVCEWSQSSLRD